MENKFRNEMTITLGEEKILLRPTFENIAAMEQNVGSVAWLGWKFSRGVRITEAGLPVIDDVEQTVKSLPSMSETTKIIYFNQAATKENDSTQKKFSLEEIWQMVLAGGAAVTRQVVIYLARVTAGNKAVDEGDLDEKKS